MDRNESIQTASPSAPRTWRPRAARISLAAALGLALALTVLLAGGAASGPGEPPPEQAADVGAAQARRWLSETVDNSADMGYHVSLELEPIAPYTPHISYSDDTNTALKHAWWTPSGWLSETVDNSESWVGGYNSLALEPAAPYVPHISYRDDINTALKHAWWTPSGWLSETVDNSGDVGWGTSLALEPGAPYTLHVSYSDDTNDVLKHAWWTPSGWLSETVNDSGWHVHTSLALEPVAPYAPHISYRSNTWLDHAWWTPSGWLSETVDNSGQVGWYSSLALEPVAPYTPHISYYDGSNLALKHAWWTPSGWLSETVDSSADIFGWGTSLALEPTAPYAPHISYRDTTNDTLKHAWWTPSGWLSETVDSSADVGSGTSLALEPAPPYAAHISYNDNTNVALKYAWLTLHRWVLFDEAHDESNTLSWTRAQQVEPGYPEWVYFGQLSSTLASEFTLVRNLDAPLTPQYLQGYDALILSAPRAEFTSEEIAAIQLFVDGGGGLIVLGDCGLEHPANVFLSDYDIALDEHCIFSPIPQLEGDFAVTEFTSRPAVAGVSSFVTNFGQSLELGSGAADLAWTENDVWQDYNWNDTYDAGTDPTGPFAIAAGYDTGCRRVAVVSDNSFQDDGFEWRGNAPLMRALLHWVTGGPECDLPFVYLPLVLDEYE
jgi:hypothetical protein